MNKIEKRKSFKYWNGLLDKVQDIIKNNKNPEFEILYLFHIFSDIKRIYMYQRTSEWYRESLKYLMKKNNCDDIISSDEKIDYEFMCQLIYGPIENQSSPEEEKDPFYEEDTLREEIIETVEEFGTIPI